MNLTESLLASSIAISMAVTAVNCERDYRRERMEAIVSAAAASETHKLLVYEELTGRDTSTERSNIEQVVAAVPAILQSVSDELAANPGLIADTQAAIEADPSFAPSVLDEATTLATESPNQFLVIDP